MNKSNSNVNRIHDNAPSHFCKLACTYNWILWRAAMRMNGDRAADLFGQLEPPAA